MKCYGCGDDGHIEPNCPNAVFDDGKPPWCGFCDEKTRLIDGDTLVARCQRCHPLRLKQLRQYRKCPHCHVTVHDWDNEPCGRHSGPSVPDKRPDREDVHAVVAAVYEPKDVT